MRYETAFAWGWAVLVTVGVILEARALSRAGRPDTLSEFVWSVFSVKEKKRGWRLRRSILLLGMVWLTVHFVSGGNIV